MTLIVRDADAAMNLLIGEGEAPFVLGSVSDTPGVTIADEARLFA